MAKTNEQIDNLNKVLIAQGKDALPYEDDSTNSGSETPEEIEAKRVAEEEAEKERLRIEAEEKEKAASGAPKEEVAPVVASELTDEQFLAFYEKKTGKKLTSLDELKPVETEEEIQKKKEQRDSDVVAFGLQNKLFTSEQYKNYVADVSNKQDLVFENYKADALEADSRLTEADILAEFNEKYGIDSEEGSRRHKRGQKELDIIADKIIRSSYQEILSVEDKYGAHVSDINAKAQVENKIAAELPKYKADVQFALTEVQKITTKFTNGDVFEIPVVAEAVERVSALILDEKYARNMAANGWNKDQLVALVKTHVVMNNIDAIIENASIQYNLKKQAGSRGIPPSDGKQRDEERKIVLTEDQKTVLKMYGKEIPVAN